LVVLLLLIGLRPASAGAVSYTEDWTVTAWRVARIKLTAVISDGLYNSSGQLINYLPNYAQTQSSPTTFCLGPAAWTVTGVVDGRSYTEQWAAQDWLDTTDGYGVPYISYHQPDDGVAATYETQSTCENNSGFTYQVAFPYRKCVLQRGSCSSSSQWQDVIVPTEPIQVLPTGMYGGLVAYNGVYNQTTKAGRRLYKMGLRSIPQRWTITGAFSD